MDVPHRAMASPVGRRLSSFARARASSSSARRTWSADPGFPFWLAPSRRLFIARDDETMLSPRRSSASRRDSAEPKLHWFRDLLRVRSRTVRARTQRCRFFLLPLLLLRQGSTDGAVCMFLIALRAQASAAQRSEESRLSGKNRRASREEKPVAQ